MKDIMGKEIKVGQKVVTMDTSYRCKTLAVWRVVGFSKKQVRLVGYQDNSRVQYPSQLAVVE